MRLAAAVLSLLLLSVAPTAATGQPTAPVVPFVETYEASPGSDYTWYELTSHNLGNQDAPVPPGVTGWGQQCLLIATGGAGGRIYFFPMSRARVQWDVYVGAAPRAISGWYVHLGSLGGGLPSLFVWGEYINNQYQLTLMDGGQTLDLEPIATGAHHISITADIPADSWYWAVDDVVAATGHSTWSDGARFEGLAYAVWNMASPGGELWLDNFSVSAGSDVFANQLFMPLVGS